MDHNDVTNEPYTTKAFAKDIATSTALSLAEVAAAWTILLGGSYVAMKIIERRKAKNSRIIEN